MPTSLVSERMVFPVRPVRREKMAVRVGPAAPVMAPSRPAQAVPVALVDLQRPTHRPAMVVLVVLVVQGVLVNQVVAGALAVRVEAVVVPVVLVPRVAQVAPAVQVAPAFLAVQVAQEAPAARVARVFPAVRADRVVPVGLVPAVLALLALLVPVAHLVLVAEV